MTLSDAVQRSIIESDADGDYVGLIAIDKDGNICTGTTAIAQTLYAAYYDGSSYRTFLQDIK